MKTKPVSTKQVQLIRTLCSRLGIDDEAYRDALAEFRVAGKPATSCKELSYAQASAWIDQLRRVATSAGVWSGVDKKREDAPYLRGTKAQLKRLRYHAMFCGIRYADLGSYKLENGVTLTGEALRVWARSRFDVAGSDGTQCQAEVKLPDSIFRTLYSRWINPMANKFLQEGGYKKDVKSPSRLFYFDLPREEVQYLITRFREMQAQIEIQDHTVSVPLTLTIGVENVSKN